MNETQHFMCRVKTLIGGIKFLLTIQESIIYLSETFEVKQQTLTARFFLNVIDIFLVVISCLLVLLFLQHICTNFYWVFVLAVFGK